MTSRIMASPNFAELVNAAVGTAHDRRGALRIRCKHTNLGDHRAWIERLVKLGKLKLTVEQIINAVDPVALANERFAGPHAAQPHMRQPALDGKIRWMDHVELADKTLKLNQPVEIHRNRMRWRISTG
jgi:hypothetical protein